MTFELSFDDTDLSSRTQAARHRAIIAAELQQGHDVVINFDGVVTVTGGVVDELFGSLVTAFGVDVMSEQITISNCNPAITTVIAHAIVHRTADNVYRMYYRFRRCRYPAQIVAIEYKTIRARFCERMEQGYDDVVVEKDGVVVLLGLSTTTASINEMKDQLGITYRRL